MDAKERWGRIYRAKAPDEVSWYQPEARLSVELPRTMSGTIAPTSTFSPTRRTAHVTWPRRGRAVRPGGHLIVASFAPEGPARCSGREVARYTPEAMHARFGAGFRLLDSVREDHQTPGGALQAFVYFLCRVEARHES